MKWSVGSVVQGYEGSVCYIQYGRAGEIKRSDMIAKTRRHEKCQGQVQRPLSSLATFWKSS